MSEQAMMIVTDHKTKVHLKAVVTPRKIPLVKPPQPNNERILFMAPVLGGKRITSEHHENHHYRHSHVSSLQNTMSAITSEHPKNRAPWLLTGATLWDVTRSQRCVYQNKAPFRDRFLT